MASRPDLSTDIYASKYVPLKVTIKEKPYLYRTGKTRNLAVPINQYARCSFRSQGLLLANTNVKGIMSDFRVGDTVVLYVLEQDYLEYRSSGKKSFRFDLYGIERKQKEYVDFAGIQEDIQNRWLAVIGVGIVVFMLCLINGLKKLLG